MGSTRGPKEKPPWAKPIVDHVKPPEAWPDNFIGGVEVSVPSEQGRNLFAEVLGAKLERIYTVPADIPGYLCIRFYFDNGKSITLSGHNCNFTTAVRVMRGDWEMIPAEKEDDYPPMPKVKSPREDDKSTICEERDKNQPIDGANRGASADLREIDGAGQDRTKGIRIGHPQVGPIEN